MQRNVPSGILCYTGSATTAERVATRAFTGEGEAVRYEVFEANARRMWREIPEEYKAGVDGLVVERRALPHPKLRDIYTLGECLTESYPSSFEGPETLRSRVVLYYGSFLRLSRLEPEFDWEGEIWETLTHELRHHLESLAAEDALEDVDYAVDENFKRLEGDVYDPYFYRSGEEVEPGVYVVEDDVFVEGKWPEEGTEWVEFRLGRVRYRVRAPRGSADVWYIRLTSGVNVDGEAHLVLARRAGLWESVRAVMGGRRARVVDTEAEAERL